MSTLSANIAATMEIAFFGDQDSGNSTFRRSKDADIRLENGTGDDQVDRVFADTRTIAGSATDSLDLAGGSLTDPLGNALTFAKVKAIMIRPADGNGGNLRVGGNANAFQGPFQNVADQIDVAPGGAWLHVDPDTGWTVTPTTGDILDVENLHTAQVTYEIVILGTSA